MADLQRGEDTHWLYIRLPSTASDPYQRIRRKLSTEATQLSGCADAVILLDSGGLRHGIFSNRDLNLQGIADAFESRHTSTTAFGVFAQPLKMDGTRGLAGAYFSLAPTALSSTFWDSVISVDQRSTVLWELDQLRR